MGRGVDTRVPVAAKRAPGDEDYELLYSRDNVAVHPSANERINGQLRLIKQGFSIFMTWMPCTDAGRKQKGTSLERDNLYTIRAVSLEEMKSIRRHTPPFGWQYIIVVLNTGLAFPPLYFHNGGVREFLAVMRDYAHLGRASDDPNVYLVNDIQDPLQKSLSTLALEDVPRTSLIPISGSSDVSRVPPSSAASPSTAQEDRLSSIEQIEKRQLRDPNFPLQVLEKFSMVTKFARDTTAQLMTGLENMNTENNKRQALTMQPLPTPVQVKKEEQHEDGEASAFLDYEFVDDMQDETPSLAPQRPRELPLDKAEWNTFLDAEGRINDPAELKKRVFRGGVEPSLRPLVWKFLLEFFTFNSTQKEREALVSSRRQEYRVLKSQWQSVSIQQAMRFSKYRDRKSRIEKDVVRTDRILDFYSGDDNLNVQVLKDILITYSFYNFDLGYCQGMSDILSPILYVMKDEEEAFWCFAALMERLGPNFHRDQNGMHSQLLALSKLVQLLDPPLQEYLDQVDCLNYFFCFRWILIQFKREFAFEDVLRLWEVLWSRHLSEHFHLYICVALLKRHRRRIMDEHMEFDSLLRFINDLSGQINLVTTLHDAEALCQLAGDAGVACIPPGTPPALTTSS